MAKLLYIEASPKGAASRSSQVAKAFLDAYLARNPEDEIDHLDLFRDDLPPFDEEAANQKMSQIASLIATGQNIGPAGQWAGVIAEIERLKSADKVVISCPMWNFSIPHRLKHYIDLVCQPGLTFYVNRKGEYVGMIKGKPMQLILSSGSAYAPRFPEAGDGAKTDFQRAYLEHISRAIGFSDIRVISIQPTDAILPEELPALIAEKSHEAATAAESF